MTPGGRSARVQLLALACEAGVYRNDGGRFGDLVQRARDVARLAAEEGVPLSSALAGPFMMQRDRQGRE